jgi:hypothetical protein
MAKRASLTGSWSGAYRYPRGSVREVVFNAQIEEIGGTFTGAIQEPNTMGHTSATVLTSDIDGDRTGQSVRFIKFYDGSGEQHHAVRYEGTVNEALTRIEGTWTIRSGWSGTFFMSRDDDGEGAEAQEQAEATTQHKN